ncbi:hypothetical protein CH354_04300 [Leptospira levettii]|uniref:hypothetical protein n=1 Tax=Leptospira levettii TaxID=2023178 RepID=UPI000C29798B|nr:hypothetical protein [Leptospira levettii]PJZ38448.1 hypothetical protein CH354_04300 [Leptospira levettii]
MTKEWGFLGHSYLVFRIKSGFPRRLGPLSIEIRTACANIIRFFPFRTNDSLFLGLKYGMEKESEPS